MQAIAYPNKQTLNNLVNTTTRNYVDLPGSEDRKQIGQFFTPSVIAEFMAGLADFSSNSISVLDPGAGTGILAASLCDEIIRAKIVTDVKIDFYENDPNVIPTLEENIEIIRETLSQCGIKSELRLLKADFIATNSLVMDDSFFRFDSVEKYDIVISNPPYFKVNKEDLHAKMMRKIVHGQPNIYSFFMAVSAELLKEGGQLIFITPRSYCSGLYFKRFRKWFLNKIKPVLIHEFESRKETFKNEVLQETIIIKGIKQVVAPAETTFSISHNSDFYNSNSFTTNYENVIYPNDPEKIIHIPKKKSDMEILRLVKSWKSKFRESGFRISTGPVVSFRATEFTLNSTTYDGITTVPLLWMNHLRNLQVQFPLTNFNKPQTIKVCRESVKLLLKNRNYVLVKRFTSKEQKKRVTAFLYLKKNFNIEYIGFENHLNYVWKPAGELTEAESWGIAALLNSTLIDKYFRMINGNTQVNASEINELPFPDHQVIVKIGKHMMNQKEVSPKDIDSIILLELPVIDDFLRRQLLE